MSSAQTTVTVVIQDEVSSGVIATTTEIVSDPSFWETIKQFIMSIF